MQRSRLSIGCIQFSSQEPRKSGGIGDHYFEGGKLELLQLIDRFNVATRMCALGQ